MKGIPVGWEGQVLPANWRRLCRWKDKKGRPEKRDVAGTCCLCRVMWCDLTKATRTTQRSGAKQPLPIFSFVFQPCPSQIRGLDHPGSGAALLFKLFLPACVIKAVSYRGNTVHIFLLSPLPPIMFSCFVVILPVLVAPFSQNVTDSNSLFLFCGYSSCSSCSLFPKCNWL